MGLGLTSRLLADMPRISNIGGSLTSAVVLTLLAWGVRFLRATAQRGKDGSKRSNSAELVATLPRFFASLSPAAIRMLVEIDPIPHVLMVLRSSGDSSDSSASNGNLNGSPTERTLPAELACASVHIPDHQVAHVLSGRDGDWPCRVAGPPLPFKGHLLVLIATGAQPPKTAATAAAAAGYQRVAYLEGGAAAFHQPARNQAQADLQFINRDALSVLIGGSGSSAVVLDLRRHDERTLYGGVASSYHIPVDELPAALELSLTAWQDRYRFPKPGGSSTVVMLCRANRRASWAAQLAHDAGLPHVLVYKQGVYGWRLDPNVRSYQSYDKWEAPPDPEPCQIDTVDMDAARDELDDLGLPYVGR